MTKPNDGGPAFPQSDLSAYGMGPSETNNQGMTLRDWFAGQCDIKVYFPRDTFHLKHGRYPTVQELACYIADIRHHEARAMLAEREAKP